MRCSLCGGGLVLHLPNVAGADWRCLGPPGRRGWGAYCPARFALAVGDRLDALVDTAPAPVADVPAASALECDRKCDSSWREGPPPDCYRGWIWLATQIRGAWHVQAVECRGGIWLPGTLWSPLAMPSQPERRPREEGK